MNKLLDIIYNSIDKIDKFFNVIDFIIAPLLRLFGYLFLAGYLMVIYIPILTTLFELPYAVVSKLIMICVLILILTILMLRSIRLSISDD